MKKAKIILYIAAVLVALITISSLFLIKMKNSNETIISLTSEEKVADFEYLCSKLNDSYPFWNEVANNGINKDAIYQKYRTEVRQSKTDISFMKIIMHFLDEFNGYGHLSVLDGNMYFNTYARAFELGRTQLSDDELHRMKPWYDVFYNPASKQTYSLLDKSHKGFRSTKGLKDEYVVQDTGNKAEEEVNSQNPSFKIIEEGKIAYIKINSFRFESIDNDLVQLQNFFKRVAKYPDLIIDIQDNSGGSDKYWQELIAAPNLSEAKTFKRYYLIRESDINKLFLSSVDDDNNILPIDHLPEFDKLKKDDLSLFSHYVLDEKTISPTANEPAYGGRIWVLTSPGVYSSSENFVMFCKNTGFATLVGTPTGGDGGIADPILLPLPNSGLIIRFSMFYGLNDDGTGNEATGTLPDISNKENENALDICISQISSRT